MRVLAVGFNEPSGTTISLVRRPRFCDGVPVGSCVLGVILLAIRYVEVDRTWFVPSLVNNLEIWMVLIDPPLSERVRD